MKIISVCSAKGGVGKTTVSLNLALAFADAGKRVLLVDLDPQGGIGHSLAKGDTDLGGLAEVLMGQSPLLDALQATKHPRLTLLPRGRLDPVYVVEFEQALHDGSSLPNVLRDEVVASQCDVALLDTPSGLGAATRGALQASDYALVPFQAEALALRSLSQTLRVLDHIRRGENPKLQLLGIVPTMVDRDVDASQQALQELWDDGDVVTDAILPRSEAFAAASAAGVPVAYLSQPPPIEARRFDLLAAELDARMTPATTTWQDHGGRRALL